VWDALLGLHGQDGYVSASAIAEGGILLRLFEAALGSGYGARISLEAFSDDVGARHGPSPACAPKPFGGRRPEGFGPQGEGSGPQGGVPLPSTGTRIAPGRKEGAIFGEFVGSVLLEVPCEYNLDGQLGDVPYRVIGEVLPDPQLILLERGKVVWQEPNAALDEVWSKTFREVIE
jgi:phosphoribosylformylglycinamidine (FGAM) synthase-like enzyme